MRSPSVSFIGTMKRLPDAPCKGFCKNQDLAVLSWNHKRKATEHHEFIKEADSHGCTERFRPGNCRLARWKL